MSSLAFLGIALIVAIIGSAIVVFVNRERHSTFEGSIEQHREKLEALEREPVNRRNRRR